MMFISQYGLPLAAALLLLMFFLCLPDLRFCDLPQFGIRHRESGAVRASLPIIFISIAYSAVAFFNLGNTVSPESF